jgi:pyruvate dehydrogenase E1 component alpha subunit
MAELFGRKTGLCKGKGGSMHLVDVERKFMGGYAIVGGHLPLATGLAFAARYQKRDQVVLCFFGEGALPSGQAHEALNLAALWKLPVVFICENNRYAMGTPGAQCLAMYATVTETARAYGIETMQVDGMVVLAIRTTVRDMVQKVRDGHGPLVLEAKTYRFLGHSMSDPSHGHYRTKEEVEMERKRDPLLLLQQSLRAGGLAGDREFKALEEEVSAAVTAAVRFAEESPFPDPDELYDDLIVE